MPKQYLENKLGHKIKYDPDGKKYRYTVNGDPKSSVTTVINTRTRPDLKNWYKKNRYNAIKEIMLEDGEPLDKINVFMFIFSLDYCHYSLPCIVVYFLHLKHIFYYILVNSIL